MIRIPGGIPEGLQVSQWLKDKGYVHEKDFNWYCDSRKDQVIVVCANQKLETMIALKWGQADD